MKVSTYILGSFGTNCYFITNDVIPTDNRVAIVDPGSDAQKILSKLNERQLCCSHILLTHAHFDHIMALEELRKATGAPVYIHVSDADMLTDNDLNCMNIFCKNSVILTPAEHTVNDGDKIDLPGGTFTVMHTPGHTPGSVCYVSENIAICGDTIFRNNIGRYDLPRGDFAKLITSLKKIASLPDNTRLYPGHGASTTVGREKDYNIYLK